MLAHLHAEREQELDGVGLDDRVDRARRRLQVGEDVLREELDDVDERVGRRDALLLGRAARRDRREEEDGRVLRLPVGLRRRGVLLRTGELGVRSSAARELQ